MSSSRHAGVTLPLFSARSGASWGIGELPDLVPLATWLEAGGFDRLMVLPLGTMQDAQASPYATVSTLAIDPIFIAVAGLPDFERAGGAARLSPEAREILHAVRDAPRIQYEAVRRLKTDALDLAFRTFFREEWGQLTTRASAFAAYIARERWWLDDYALFQALSRSMPGRSWREWPAPLRDRDARALDEARRQLSREVVRQQYLQWIAESQWQEARAAAREHGVAVFGDLPFVAATDSADVWARASEFQPDLSVGVPPDAFSPTGQDWGLPAYRWDVIAASDYSWIRLRARRVAALFDGMRVDHTVGLYRTYARPPEGEAFFIPADEAAQRAQGEAVFRILKESGLDLIAEDLGVVPDFVRASLASLGVPGCKVLRWERDWHAPGAPFLDPSTFAPRSAAMTGTHDTEPLALWWEHAAEDERGALLALPFFAERGLIDPAACWTPALGDALLELAFRSGSDHLFIPMQDLFGWPDRINTPATVGDQNWTWMLPWPVERLSEVPEAVRRAGYLRGLAGASGR